MLKMVLIAVMILIPALSYGQSRIYGDVTNYGAGSGEIYLRDSDGGSASITVYPDRSFTIDQRRGTSIQDLERSTEATRQSIESLGRELRGNLKIGSGDLYDVYDLNGD